MQWAGNIPGALIDRVGRRARPEDVPEAGHPLAALASHVVASPRANAYLSLEAGLRQFATSDGLVTWAGSRRMAFATGGFHARGDATHLMADFRDALAAARYKRILSFPIATPERPVVRAAGFRTMCVGAEAFVDPQRFSLAGKAKADLRQMVNRGTKRYGLVVTEVPVAAAAAGLDALYQRWLVARPVGHRMSLLIGTPCFDRAAGRRYFAVHRRDEPALLAFASITPGWGGAGCGVDVMVRPPDAPAGAMDVLLTGIIRQLADEGTAVFSLGACPMTERGPIPGRDAWVLRKVFRWLYRSRLANRLFPFQSLARYKDKFDPRWEPVHIGAWPHMGVRALYTGCRLWGLFGPPPLVTLTSFTAAPRRSSETSGSAARPS